MGFVQITRGRFLFVYGLGVVGWVPSINEKEPNYLIHISGPWRDW